jgi:hypothetical protein
MKRVAVVQSNYIPWKGYFDMIAAVDEFILFDDVQYTRRDWRNRNQIKTPHGLQWLTVPIVVKGRYNQKIRETEIHRSEWAATHWKALWQNYRQASCFPEIAAWLEPLYLDAPYGHLSQLNRRFIEAICRYLDVETRITNSWDYRLLEGKTERLASLCAQAGGTEYISGPRAKGYIEEGVFDAMGIRLTWFDYEGYEAYPQLWGEFIHGVSVLDLLFNCGKQARRFMRRLRE